MGMCVDLRKKKQQVRLLIRSGYRERIDRTARSATTNVENLGSTSTTHSFFNETTDTTIHMSSVRVVSSSFLQP